MTTRTADRLDDWESRPFTDGYEELRTLSDRSFSGAVTTGRATLHMLNGTVVGILNGSIEDFADATGTIHESPTPALPLLAVMQERSDEVRAKYYSEETALREADEKLSEGGFTGYVELSENILSGDYYVVYHGGKSMSVAFVGESERLISGDEAFERADEEVGIYKVRPVSIDPIEIPEPEEPAAPADSTAAPSAAGSTTADETPAMDDETVDTSKEGLKDSASTDEPDTTSEASGAEPPDTIDESTPDAAETEPPSEAADSSDRNRTAETDPSSGGTDSSDRNRTAETRTRADTPDRQDRDPTSETSSQPDEAASRSRSSGENYADRSHPSETDGRSGDRSDRGRTERTTPGDPDRHQSRERRAGQDDPADRAASEQDPADRRGSGRRNDRQRDHRPDTDDRGSGDRRADPTTDRTLRDAPSETRESQPRQDAPESNLGASSSSRDGPNPSQPVTGDRVPTDEHSSPSGDSGADSGSDETSLERRVIPSIDPDRTWTPDDDRPSNAGIDTRRRSSTGESASGSSVEDTGRADPTGTVSDSRQAAVEAELQEAGAEITDLERRIDELRSRQSDLEAERDELAAERDELQLELDRVRGERDDLKAEVEQLRTTVTDLEDRLERTGGAASTAGTTFTPTEAIDGTNLFVRYDSKGEETLEAAHQSAAKAEAVNENLNLEYHTQFDTEDAAVDGEPYEEFLTGTIHYRFVEWVVRELLYEIHDTGHKKSLADLYDAIPRIDRAELNASISVTYTEDGEEQRTQENFDIVLRDRMGNPLIVTNLNDSREAATGEMMSTLVTAATRVGESSEHFSGAFFVTSSFFDPGALETASEATGGGILSRDKRKSFVRLSRKDGFHLCLVESRDGDFHLAVPEI